MVAWNFDIIIWWKCIIRELKKMQYFSRIYIPKIRSKSALNESDVYLIIFLTSYGNWPWQIILDQSGLYKAENREWKVTKLLR